MFDLWHQFSAFERLLEAPNQTSTAQPGRRRPQRDWAVRPTIDLYELSDRLVLKAVVPGVDFNDIEIGFEHGVLTLHGRLGYTLDDSDCQGASWHRKEIASGVFDERLWLPAAVDPDRIQASLEHGILTIQLWKVELTRAHRLDGES